MSNARVFNFSAGPAAIPLEVLEKAQQDLVNYQSKGLSVMEMSHRSKAFEEILATTEDRLRKLLSIPDEYAVLFLQGGASLQFSMIPMNLAIAGKPINMIHTGIWSGKAIDELKKGFEFEIISSGESTQFKQIPALDSIKVNPNASYVHMVSNNTVYGTQFKQFPNTGEIPLIADMSSDILSRPIDISKFGLIFAGAQKNLGPSGVTLVIIRKDLAERASNTLPTMLNYKTHIKAGSLYNTPPTFSIYILGLMLEWVSAQGGVAGIQAQAQAKSEKLYTYIDQSGFYQCPNEVNSRSQMNVVFRIKDQNEALEKSFASEAEKVGLLELKGHRSAGGLRASLYNGVPREAVEALITFMEEFKNRNS
jgi:phosphoserine aminotransferase